MIELEPRRVEEGPRHRQRLAHAAVGRVPDDGMTNRREVYADLMRATGLERAVEQTAHRRVERRTHLVTRARRASFVAYGHACATGLRPRDRRVDDASRRV